MLATTRHRLGAALLTLTLVTATGGMALAQKKYDTGASDTEIKIGNIVPYSGPASAYGVVGKAMGAVFKKVNDEGGINGRKINFITYDDAYTPPKAVEQARKLIESDEVLLLFGTLGTASNTAIQKYVNAKKVPQLFVATGATKWNDPKSFPWTMGWLPSYQSEVAHLCQVPGQGKAGGQDRRALPERRHGQGLLEGPEGRFRQRCLAYRRRGELRGVGADHRVPRRAAEVRQSRRRRVLHDAEIRRAGHQEARRDGLEADDHHFQCQRLDRDRDAARGPRQFARRDLGCLRQGRQRSAMGW